MILAIYVAPIAGSFLAGSWFALKVAAAIPRFALGWAYLSNKWRPEPSLASTIVQVSLVIDGAVWGLVGIWSATRADDTTAGLLLGCLSSVAMLATFGLQVQLRATAAFVGPIMAPMALALASAGDLFGLTAAGGAALVLVQSIVTGYASERRMRREYDAQERLETALVDRSNALDRVQEASRSLEQALVEVQRQSAAKAVFLGTMSHELRTPLHGILGLTSLVKRNVEDSRMRRELSLIESSGQHLLDLITALLDVARIDSGHLNLHPVPTDILKEIHELADLYAIRAQTKGIGFLFSMTSAIQPWVHADPARLRQILHNLLGNAIKFTERGQVSLTVSQTADVFMFSVTDTGRGIAETELPKVFEAFRQIGDTVQRPSEGTGLGLTIARELAHAMSGDIVVDSTVGRGSTFNFSAPFPRCEAASYSTPSTSSPPLTFAPSHGHVLLAEDNEVNSMIALAHLQALQLECDRVEDGRRAVTAATAHPRPALVLMDCQMPDMDGLTATRKIREWEREHGMSRVPIVALTATVDKSTHADCLRVGMDDVLAKPFTAADLTQVIAVHLDNVGSHSSAIAEFARSLEDSDDLLLGPVLH